MLERHRSKGGTLVRLLRRPKACRWLAALIVAGLGCGPDSAGLDASTRATDHADSSGAPSDGTVSADATSSSSSIDDSTAAESSTTALPDLCPPANPEIYTSGVVAIAQDWPDGGFEDVSCEAVSLAREPHAVLLSCTHPETLVPVDVRINVPESAAEDQLSDIAGASDLRVSFYKTPEGSIGCVFCNHVTIRDATGDLILLGHLRWDYSYPAEGVAFEVGRAGWLEAGTPAYDAWSAPFEDLVVRNVGCVERENLRPGSDTETPLALQFTADTGVVSIYDRNVEYAIEVGGQRFDILVSDAFFRGPLTCGDCFATESSFLILRSRR